MNYRIILLAVTTAFRCFATTATIDVGDAVFPAKVGDAPWAQITNYTPHDPASGVGASYRLPQIKTDIYLYTAINSEQASRPPSERLLWEYQNIADIMRQMEQRGHYLDLVLSPRDDFEDGALKIKRYDLSYTERDTPRVSRYYLAIYGERLLKIRITAERSTPDSIIDDAFRDAVHLYK